MIELGVIAPKEQNVSCQKLTNLRMLRRSNMLIVKVIKIDPELQRSEIKRETCRSSGAVRARV